ncbi:MAG: hypothetical protein KJZ81_00230 [Burkholderiaceae bacterium]|jgi:hypothetical protein|nr:hypothetical protein [Burkholderiaceae bacterium]
MPAQLMRPEVLLLIVFVLWGIAGKLDEPLEGFDPEPVQAEAAATEGGPAAQSLHLLCVVEEAGPDSRRQAPTPVLTAYSPTPPGLAGRHAVTSRRLTCVVTDEQETP